MLKGIKAGELFKKAGGAKGVELAKNGTKKAANHKAVDKAFQKGIDTTVESAVGGVIGFATGGGGAAAVKRKRDKRRARRDAVDLARQVGGTYSLNVIIGSERHHVVWLADETPYRVIPELKDAGPLEELPDIKQFRSVRHKPRRQKS